MSGVMVEVTEVVDGQQVTLQGRVGVREVPDLRLLLHEVIDTGLGDVRVDLAGAEVQDSTGLGMLLECHLRARRAGRRLVLVAVTDRTRRLLTALRLDRVLLPGRERPRTVSTLTA